MRGASFLVLGLFFSRGGVNSLHIYSISQIFFLIGDPTYHLFHFHMQVDQKNPSSMFDHI